MSASHPNQYTDRGTKPSWRHWKKKLKTQTVRYFRRLAKNTRNEVPRRVTCGTTY